MNIYKISTSFLINNDHILDYIPFVSTLSNIAAIFFKFTVLSKMEKPAKAYKPKYKPLDKKSYARCFLLLLPVIGNLIIGISDYLKSQTKTTMLATVELNGLDLQYASDELKNDSELAYAAFQENIHSLEYVGKKLKDNTYFCISILKLHGTALRYFEKFQDHIGIASIAVSQNGRSLQYASPRIKNNKTIVLKAVQQDGTALKYASEDLRDNDEVVFAAVKQNPSAIRYASPDLWDDPKLLKQCVST